MATSKRLTTARLSDILLGAAGRSIPPSEPLNHGVRFLSTWSGSDKLFMVCLAIPFVHFYCMSDLGSLLFITTAPYHCFVPQLTSLHLSPWDVIIN